MLGPRPFSSLKLPTMLYSRQNWRIPSDMFRGHVMSFLSSCYKLTAKTWSIFHRIWRVSSAVPSLLCLGFKLTLLNPLPATRFPKNLVDHALCLTALTGDLHRKLVIHSTFEKLLRSTRDWATPILHLLAARRHWTHWLFFWMKYFQGHLSL